jgi:hypothetical protein
VNLFFTLALLAPRMTITVYFLVPVEIRFVAIASALFLLSDWVRIPAARLALPWSLLSFFLVAGPVFWRAVQSQSAMRPSPRKATLRANEDVFHGCAVCGKNDVSNPDEEFRVGADDQEYCREHLAQAGSGPRHD